MSEINRQWVLTSHPTGMPSVENFKMVEGEMPAIGEGQVLARSIYLSLDPYMRGRISAAANYAAGVGIDDCMHGGAVAEIVASNHPDYQVGDIVENINFGWQDYAALNVDLGNGKKLHKVDKSLGPIHSAIGYLGMPGLTAYLALRDIGQPKTGDTVVISAASGAVGQIAGQIAKIKGARPVAVASSQDKLDYCASLGYEAGINYRDTADLDAAMKETCPDGVDVFFDNTAGPIHDAVMKNLAPFSRIIICGTISLAGKFEEPDMGQRFMRQVLVARAKMQGFLIFDYGEEDIIEARQQLASWAKEGKLQHKEDIKQGFEKMPESFIDMLTSKNFGKLMVQTRDDPTV
ncbi:NADP-dependent oxidoreductase [Curvivirga sp.]|uniref:NADP-dependent oxidoreductase n=1 Tax=Curvivirga sp. TaxID=2856848 RepID=UPI003B5A3182